jgi:predicted nucleic acid-binding protein
MAGEHASVISGRYNDLFNPDKLLSELNEMLNRLATQLRVKYEPTKQSRIISLKVAIVSEGGKYEALKERLIAMSDSDDSRRIESQLRLIQGRLAPLQGELQNLLNPPTEPPRR